MTESSPFIQTIFPEMMIHPALFTHSNPKNIIILGDHQSTLRHEAIKHTGLQNISHGTPPFEELARNTIDVIIHADDQDTPSLYETFFELLDTNGILVQQCASPFHMNALNKVIERIKAMGFSDIQLLNFPQPDYPTGWRSILMALKSGVLKRPSEKLIFNKPFATQFYNYDTHKAATALPEFVRNNLIF